MKNTAKKSNKTEQGQRVTKAIVASETVKIAKEKANPHAAWATKRVEILDARLGAGVGAKRERERLAKLIG